MLPLSRNRFESQLSAEREATLRYKGENGIMKKKFTVLTKDIEDQKVGCSVQVVGDSCCILGEGLMVYAKHNRIASFMGGTPTSTEVVVGFLGVR